MARVIYEEFQDKEGNVHYLHTEDKVVFTEDGRPLRTAMNAVQFEDYSGETELPSASQALAGIAKGRKWTDIFSAVKAFCKRAVTVEAVGDAFSETNDYQAGDYAIYNNALYKFTADKAAGAWDGTKADAVKVADEIRQLNGNMSHVGTIIHSTTLDTMEKVIAVYGGRRWQRIEGMFLLGASESYEIGSTGGEATHKLTVQEMPSHTHKLPKFAVATDNSKNITQYDTATGVCNSTGFISETSAAGNGKSHNNMPPYRVVYIWERTA